MKILLSAHVMCSSALSIPDAKDDLIYALKTMPERTTTEALQGVSLKRKMVLTPEIQKVAKTSNS